jgi:protein-disulfide isomerase
MADKKTAKDNSLKKKSDKTTRYLVIGMVVFVVIAGVGAALAKNNSKSHVALPSQVTKANGYGITFNPTAKVRVDMYEDFRCPNCRNFEGANSAYINGLARAGKIMAVYHPMHFLASDSQLTAAASACSSDVGKFLDFHTALYANQPTTAQAPENTPYWTNTTLLALGVGVGISSPAFTTCVNSGKYLNWTNNINDDATSKNINATPTVIVNGKTLPLATDYDNKAFIKVLTALGVK